MHTHIYVNIHTYIYIYIIYIYIYMSHTYIHQTCACCSRWSLQSAPTLPKSCSNCCPLRTKSRRQSEALFSLAARRGGRVKGKKMASGRRGWEVIYTKSRRCYFLWPRGNTRGGAWRKRDSTIGKEISEYNISDHTPPTLLAILVLQCVAVFCSVLQPTHIFTETHIDTHAPTYVRARTHTHTPIQMQTLIHANTYTCIYLHWQTGKHKYTFNYTFDYMYCFCFFKYHTHSNVCVHMHKCLQ